MKKRNESDNRAQSPSADRLSMPRNNERQESAKDFALHLAAMFRAELGEEDEQLDPVLNWELPVFEADYQEAAAEAGSDEDLYRAVADFLDDEVGEEAPGPRDDAFAVPSSSTRADREAQRRAERDAKRQAEQEARSEGAATGRPPKADVVEKSTDSRKPTRDAKRQAEQEAQRRAEREAKRQAEQEAQRRAEREAKRQAEQEAQRRAERDAKRQAEQEAQRRKTARREPADRQEERPAPPQTETSAQERMVFFEPKQKKNTFFDSLSEMTPKEEPARAELPAEPARRERRADRAEAERPERRGQTQRNARRPEKRPANRAERKDQTRRMATQARREGRGDPRENAAPAEQTDANRDPTRISLRGFSATPFEPPREDPSLEELFGPLGLKTAPPDPDDSPTRRGRTPRSAFDLPVDDPIRGDGTLPSDEATGNGQQATGEKGSGIEDQGSEWTQDAGAATGCLTEAETSDEPAGVDVPDGPDTAAGKDAAEPEGAPLDEPAGAVIGRQPEAETSDDTEGAALPEAEAPDEAIARGAGALPSAPTQAEVPDKIEDTDALLALALAEATDVAGTAVEDEEAEAARQEEMSTEDAILDALRFLGDVPYPEKETTAAEPDAEAASRYSAEPAPAPRRREKKRGWLSALFSGSRTRGETPNGTPAGTAAKAPAELPAETLVEKPAETFAEALAETVAKTPAELPAETLVETPAETFAEALAETVAKTPAELPAETLIETPAKTFAEALAETVAKTPAKLPEPEPLDEPVGAVDTSPARRGGGPASRPVEGCRPPEAEPIGSIEPSEPVEAEEPCKPIEPIEPFGPEEPASEAAASEADAPWSDDKLFAAVEALLERPFFAGVDVLNDTAASGDRPAARDAAERETADAVTPGQPGQSAAGAPSRRELDAMSVPELFDYFGLPRTEGGSGTKDQGSETGEETAPAAPNGTPVGTSTACPPSPEPKEPQAEAAQEMTPEAEHAPELWDPLSLFSEPVDDGPPPLTPLSQDTTGTLPSLEELFGPDREPTSRPPRPAARQAHPRKKRSWLQKLLGAAPPRRERPPLQISEPTADASAEADKPLDAEEPARAPEAEAFHDTVGAGVFDGPVIAADNDTAKPEEEPIGEAAGADAFDAPIIAAKTDAALPDAEIPEIPAASEENRADQGEDLSDDWDPLALFGGQAEDKELPTWEEFVRSRRAAAEAAAAPSDEAWADSETEEESLGSLPEPELPVREDIEAAWPVLPELDPDPTLEELFGMDKPQGPEPDTVPMDLSMPPEPAAPARNRRRSQSEGLTLADFLAAAVPMEEASASGQESSAETAQDRPREQTLTFGPGERQTISTAPENPAGLILTWLDDESGESVPEDETRPPAFGRGPETGRQETEAEPSAEAKPPKVPEPAAPAPSPKPGAEAAAPDIPPEAQASDKTGTGSARDAQAVNDPFASAHSVRPPEIRSPEKPPVPSADVRTSAGVGAAAADKRARRREDREGREIEVLPPEEKSILHPEEAYRVYARPLDAIGSRLILTGLFTILSLFFTLYLSQGWTFLPEIFSGGTTVYILLALLGLMVLVNRKLYFLEWRDENGLRPALLLALATIFTVLDCISAAKTLRPPFTVVVGALLMVELWGRYDRGVALTTTVKVLRAEQLSAGVSEVQDITKGSRGLIRTKPDVERFMEKLETRDLTDRLLRIYTPVAAVIGLLLTLLISLWLKRDPFWTGALVFLGTVPVTGLLAFSRLFCLLARRLSEAQAALCGYHGAEVFGGEHSILIGDDDIFPAGSLTLNGFKVYNGNPDRMIAYAAAACRSSGSALDPIFEDLLVTHNGRHYTVDNFRFYDSGGIGASIQQDVVLLGSLDFMRRMGVHMDRGARVKQAVYMSLNGELAAVFAVRYTPPDNLRRGLAAIAGNRHFKGILVTRTFLGTPGFLKAKFGIPTGAFNYPSTKERIRLSEAEMKRSGAQGAILAKDSFSGFAQAAAGGRLLRSATLGAAILTVLGGLTGLTLMGVLAALAALETATALNILLYVAAWLVPTLLLTAWARHF